MIPELNRIYLGDNRATLKAWPDNFVDAVVTDPPYELTTGKKGGTGPASLNTDSPAGRAYVTTGFMGHAWDGSGIAHDVKFWAEVLRVMKPGAHLLAFAGTRTYHRMVCAIEDAGFEIRDQIQWLYGSGFPKSLNLSKAIDSNGGRPEDIRRMEMGEDYKPSGRGRKNYDHGSASAMDRSGEKRGPASEAAKKWVGWGTALKPANEPIVVARKPLSEGTVAANVLKWGTGALNIDASRIPGGEGGEREGGYSADRRYVDEGSTDFAMKPGPRGGDAKGRWPANVILDEEAARLLDQQSGNLKSGEPIGVKAGGQGNAFGHFAGGIPVTGYGDEGGASRFFYCAKPSAAERNDGLQAGPPDLRPRDEGRQEGLPGGDNPRNRGAKAVSNFHPTVKPVDLMAYLIKLVTPPGGVVLDPFLGSGTTAIAAEKFMIKWVGCEMSPEYVELATKRIAAETAQGKLL